MRSVDKSKSNQYPEADRGLRYFIAQRDPMQLSNGEVKMSETSGKYDLSNKDLEAIAEGKSQEVPNVQFFGKTTFTIENAPIPKSIDAAIGAEKTINVQMKVRLDKNK